MLAPWWWWKARPSDLYLTEYTAMIIFGPLLVIVGIGFICWLLFTLAVFALPFFAGLTIGIWAFHTGAGVLGGIAVGLVAGGVTFGLGQLALAFVPWAWARLLIILPLCRARHRRRLQRHAWNRPDGDAFTHLADDLRRHRRGRRQRHGVRPLHRNGRARTSRTGLSAGLTSSRRRPLGRGQITHSVCSRSSSSNAE